MRISLGVWAALTRKRPLAGAKGLRVGGAGPSGGYSGGAAVPTRLPMMIEQTVMVLPVWHMIGRAMDSAVVGVRTGRR
jgi:hypothetical protein